MIRQYRPPRWNPADDFHGRHVGQVPVGTICNLRHSGLRSIGRVIVRAWINREYTAARKVDGKWQSAWMIGGHLALCQRLHNGRPVTIADHWLWQSCHD